MADFFSFPYYNANFKWIFFYLHLSNASILWRSVKSCKPILMRYGKCIFAAIANGKPHSVSERRQKNHTQMIIHSGFVICVCVLYCSSLKIVISSSLMAQCQVISLFCNEPYTLSHTQLHGVGLSVKQFFSLFCRNHDGD